MKKFFLLPLLAFCAILCGAEPVVLQKVLSCYVPNPGKASTVLDGNGNVKFTGEVKFSGKFGYLISRIQVKPFSLAGKSLAFSIVSPYHERDAFYVKATDASGKIVASFATTKPLTDSNAMICTPGSSAGGVTFIAKDVKSDPDAEITALTFYLCRRGPAPNYNTEVSNLRLIDRVGKSSVSPEAQTAPGAVKLYRVSRATVPKGKAEAVIAPDQTITLKSETKYQKYDYLIADVEVRPFVIAGNSLSLDVKTLNYAGSDGFYVKCRDAEGRIVASFACRKDITKGVTLVCTPGRNGGNVINIPKDIKSPETSPIVKLQFYSGRRGPGKPTETTIKNIKLIKRPTEPVSTGFVKYGVGVASAEVRNFIAFNDEAGRRFILCNPGDEGNVYILLTDVGSGKTEQHFTNTRGSVFGGVLTRSGKYVYGIGGQVHIFDLKTRKFKVAGKCASSNLCATEGPDGKVYMGGAYSSNFAVVDPEKGTSEFLGRMDDKEDYCSYLAVDKEGIVYAGIGTARANIIAYDPKTGKRIQLLPENLRKLGTASVVAGKDGYVYVSFMSFRAKCLGGKIVEKGVRCPDPQPIKSVKYQHSLNKFADGSMVQYYDMDKREIGIREVDGSLKKIKFDYVSGGLNLTSLASGPDGNIYVSSSHPHHLGKLDVSTGKITDLGMNPRVGGGNFCNMVSFNGKLYACEYAGGRLWSYDPSLPVHYVSNRPVNFGIPFKKLQETSNVRNGEFRVLPVMGILFGTAASDDNEFILNLPVASAGKYFLNLQFLESGSYGDVTVKAGDQQFTVNTQNPIRQSGKIFNAGPFELSKGNFQVAFNLKKRPKGNHYFGIVGIELSPTAREVQKVAASAVKNPDILAAWPDLITRPRTIAVNPVTKEVVIAGFANYGLTGGGFGIWNSRNGQISEVSDWLPGESCIDMYFTSKGDLVGGTSIEAPGGGKEKATAATLFMMDWKSKKVVKSLKFPGVRHIFGVREFGKWIYAAANDGILYQVDKKSWHLTGSFEMEGRAISRNPLLKTPDGKRMFLLQGRTISEIDPQSGKLIPVARTPWHLTAGSAVLNGRIYFIQRENVGSWKIGGK